MALRLIRRLFSKAGYSIALVARGADSIKQLSEEINASGGDVCTFSHFSQSQLIVYRRQGLWFPC